MKKRKKKQIKETDESDVFIKLNSEDALQSKKDLLQMTASLINVEMVNEKIKDHGKKEVRYRSLAKRSLKSVNALLNKIITDMPKIEKIPKMGIKEVELQTSAPKIKATPKEKAKRNSLNQELLDIQKKLAQLE